MTETKETAAQLGQAQYGEPRRDLIEAARRGDLTGMNFAILARLSDESRRRRHLKENGTDDATARAVPRFGQDINNRDEQVNQCTAQIEARGGTVVHIYDEPHTSAWKRRRVTLEDGTIGWRVIRPVYKLALSDLSKGVVTETGVRLDGMMVADVDRLTRDNRDLEDAIDEVVHFHRPILDRRGALDLLTETGRTMARAIVAFKSGQSADTALRVKDKHAAMQRAGIPTGGNRPFGWKEDKRTLEPAEARLLRQAVADILDGHAVTAITAEWNRRGITTARGKAWRAVNLQAILRNPRMAGYRMKTVQDPHPDSTGTSTRRVVIATDENGDPVIGQWKRMISPERWEALLAIIGEKPGRGDGANARTHLLTGTLRCGKDGCDTPLRATKAPASAGKPDGYFWYTCRAISAGGCGGIKIDGPKTDEVAIMLAIEEYEKIARERDARSEPAPWERQGELDAVRENMAAAKAARDSGMISAGAYYADLGRYEAQVRELTRDRNAHIKTTSVAANVPVTLAQDWLTGKLTLTQQRIYIERAFSAIIVNPSGGRRRVPVRERLVPVPSE